MGLAKGCFLNPRDIKPSEPNHFRTGLDAMIGILALVRSAALAAQSHARAPLVVVDSFSALGHQEFDPENAGSIESLSLALALAVNSSPLSIKASVPKPGYEHDFSRIIKSRPGLRRTAVLLPGFRSPRQHYCDRSAGKCTGAGTVPLFVQGLPPPGI